MNNIQRDPKYDYSPGRVVLSVFGAQYSSRHLAGKGCMIEEVARIPGEPRKIRVYLDNGKSYIARQTTGIKNKKE